MAYIGIDLVRAPALVGVLSRTAARIEPIVTNLHAAQYLADVPAGVESLLLQIEADYRLSAAQVVSAMADVESFRLQLYGWFAPPPEPVQTPSPLVETIGQTPAPDGLLQPQWNANPALAWNLVNQEASHNSYQVPGGIEGLYRHGLRSFELDIHRGAPTELVRPRSGSWVQQLAETIIDHFDHDGGSDGDWRVYHMSGSAHSEYEYLSDGLAAIAALESDDPLTVFIDNKDGFGGTQSQTDLDALIEAKLGDRLFRPSELFVRAPDATTLQQAVAQAGWPTVGQLQGRVFVVLTDQIGEYDQRDATAFIAPEPTFSAGSATLVHVPLADAVFYNADHRSLPAEAMSAVAATNSLLRTYFNPRCAVNWIGDDVVAANYRAVDAVPGEPACPPPGPHPPEGTPVPN